MCANSTTLNRQRISMRSSSTLRSVKLLRRNQPFGNAGSTLCRKPRWQVAFASLVGVALMLSLVQRTPEPLRQYDYVPAPELAVPMTDTDSAQLHRLSAPAGAMPAPVADDGNGRADAKSGHQRR
jgi:hypothetical protein